MRPFVLFAVLLLLPVFTYAQSIDALQTFEKAVAESRDGDHAKALGGFQRTLAFIERDHSSDAFFAKVHYNAGVSLYHLDRTFESAIHLEKTLSYMKGRHAKAYYLLGLIGLESNDLALAEKSLKAAAMLDNRNGDTWYDLSRVYVALGEPAKAKRAYDKAVRNGAEIVRIAQNKSMASVSVYE